MKKRLLLRIAIVIALSCSSHWAGAQGMAINTSGSTADGSAMLDVSSTSKGMLVPRMTNAQIGAIINPATSLLVYQTDGTAGFYYNSGTPGSPVWAMVGGIPASTTHNIGDAYGGCIVAYILQPGDPGYDPLVQHGLIAATSDQSGGVQWYNGTYTTTNALGTGIGSGRWNTMLIIASQGAGSYPATLCNSYTGGGYTDWYLPSKNELHELNINQAAIGGFSSGSYWSSSESNSTSTSVWFEYFGLLTGQFTYDKAVNGVLVRAVRAF